MKCVSENNKFLNVKVELPNTARNTLVDVV
jgi:hypothetical protein